MTSLYLTQQPRDLRHLEHAFSEDAKRYMGNAAHATTRGTREYWEDRARQALAKSQECRRQRLFRENG